jgi:putative transposase
MPRIARVIIENYPHHITQRGSNREKIFLDDKDKNYFIKTLFEYCKLFKIELWAFCLMENHFHLLMVPQVTQSLGQCLHGLTFRYAQYFNNKYKHIGRLWQNRYFSCPVDKDEYLVGVLRYVEENPVRAGLAGSASEWPWSSVTKTGFTNLPKWVQELCNKSPNLGYITGSKLSEIRRSTTSGRPLGNVKFYEHLEKKLERQLKPKKSGRPRIAKPSNKKAKEQ